MPKRKYTGQALGTPLALLDSLRSLSQARQFDVYLRFNSYAKIGLKELQTTMTNASPPLTTPPFDLKGMYRGERDGSLDLWEEQGLHDRSHALVTREHKHKSRKRRVLEEPGTSPPRFRRSDNASPPAYSNPSSVYPVLPLLQISRSCTPNIARGCHSVTSGSSIVHKTPCIPSSPPGIFDLFKPSLPSARLFKEFPTWLWSKSAFSMPLLPWRPKTRL